MATPPFLPDETKPGASDLISLFPAVEQTFRDIIEDWILVQHNTTGTHKQVTLDDISEPTIAATLVGIWHESGVLKTRFAGGTVYDVLTSNTGLLKTGGTLTGALTMNTGGNTNLAIDEDGLDRSSASAETFVLENSGAGTMTFQTENADFSGKADLQDVVQTTSAALTSSTGIALSMTGANRKTLVLDHDTTFTVSGEVADQIVEIEIEQGSTGGTATWSGVDKWYGGVAPILSVVTGEIDTVILQARADGSTIVGLHIGTAS